MKLLSGQLSFWRVEDDAITWRDGVTIAFREELGALLARFTVRNVPQLDALLLVLAALRGSWDGSRGDALRALLAELLDGRLDARFIQIREFLEARFETAFVDRGEGPPRDADELIAQAASGLDAVHRLAHRRGATDLETTLFFLESFFESERGAGSAARTTTEELARALRSTSDEEPVDLTDPVRLIAVQRLLRALADVLAGIWRVLGRDLDLERETSLGGLPSPADCALSARDRVRALLDELSDCERLSPIASLCRRVMAATHVPRHSSTPAELPTGGLSDITNRGSPDRLLPTELAHDGLTLAARVVLNEALYFRRETSRRRESRRRALLVDSGIRLWGRARVFAASVALALAATAGAEDEVDVASHAERGPRPESLETRAGLIALLGRLGTDAHPGGSVAEFVAASRERARRDGAGAECIVLTHELAFADEDFAAALEPVNDTLLIATVTEHGDYRLRLRSSGGTRLLQEARIPLATPVRGGE